MRRAGKLAGDIGKGESDDQQEVTGEPRHSARIQSALSTVDLHFKISPVFVYHKSKSSSSKSMPMESAKNFTFSSIARYLVFVEGGFEDSITLSSVSRPNTCLSRIAYPR